MSREARVAGTGFALPIVGLGGMQTIGLFGEGRMCACWRNATEARFEASVWWRGSTSGIPPHIGPAAAVTIPQKLNPLTGKF